MIRHGCGLLRAGAVGVLALAGVALPLCSAATATALTPGVMKANTHLNWTVSQPDQLTVFDQQVRYRVQDDQQFLEAGLTWNNNRKMYMGIQSPLGRQLHHGILAVWGAIDRHAPALNRYTRDYPWCGEAHPPGALEGESYTCLVPPPGSTGVGPGAETLFRPDHVYDYHVEVIRNATYPYAPKRGSKDMTDANGVTTTRSGTWWRAAIRDTTDGTVADLGEVLVEDNNGVRATELMHSSNNFIETFGWDPHARPGMCQTTATMHAEFSPPVFLAPKATPPYYTSYTAEVDGTAATTTTPDKCFSTVRRELTASRSVTMRPIGPWLTNTSNWSLPATPVLTSLETDIKVDRQARDTDTRTDVTLSNGSVVRLGLESGRTFSDAGQTEIIPPEAVFSVPGPPETETGTQAPTCKLYSYFGTGVDCRTEYPVTIGHTYRLSLQWSKPVEGVDTWTATVQDLTVAGGPTPIGVARVPGATGLTGAQSIQQLISAHASCDDPNLTDATFKAPLARTSTGAAYTATASGSARTPCTGGSVTTTTLDGVPAIRSTISTRGFGGLVWKDASPSPTTNLYQDITPVSAPAPGYQAKTLWHFLDGPGPAQDPVVGYWDAEFGIQTGVDRFDGTRGDVVYVSFDLENVLPEPTIPPGSAFTCNDFRGSDKYVRGANTCQLPITVTQGHRYRLILSYLRHSDDLEIWQAELLDNDTSLGRVELPAPNGARTIGGVLDKVNYNGTALPCAATLGPAVRFEQPKFNGNGTTFAAKGTHGGGLGVPTTGCLTTPTYSESTDATGQWGTITPAQ
jgi:hypothetical protein